MTNLLNLTHTTWFADSPLEGDGFEPSVPHTKQPFWLLPFGPAIRLPRQKPALSCQGPKVRIHFPPAESRVRTRFAGSRLAPKFVFVAREAYRCPRSMPRWSSLDCVARLIQPRP